jgi:hypothetical protein
MGEGRLCLGEEVICCPIEMGHFACGGTVHLREHGNRELFAQANSCRLVGELTLISMGQNTTQKERLLPKPPFRFTATYAVASIFSVLRRGCRLERERPGRG